VAGGKPVCPGTTFGSRLKLTVPGKTIPDGPLRTRWTAFVPSAFVSFGATFTP